MYITDKGLLSHKVLDLKWTQTAKVWAKPFSLKAFAKAKRLQTNLDDHPIAPESEGEPP
jgi:hypothetical protein